MFYLSWKFREWFFGSLLCLFVHYIPFQSLHRSSTSRTRAKLADSISRWLCPISVRLAHTFICPMLLMSLYPPVVGLYIEQICLACLFFLKIKITHISSIVEGVLMLVLLVITFSAQTFVHNSFDRESS